MSSLFKRIKGLFDAPEESLVKEPLVSSSLRRSSTFSERYSQWISKERYREISSALQDGLKKPGNTDTRSDFIFLSNDYFKGFIIQSDRWSTEEILFYMDHLSSILTSQDYRLYTSDRRYHDQGKSVLEVQRRYLKPDTWEYIRSMKQIDQAFGNICIETYILDGSYEKLKLQANHYQGRNYLPPRGLNELVNNLAREA